jgi:hypothetical protein
MSVSQEAKRGVSPSKKDRYVLRRERCHTTDITFIYGYEIRILYVHVLY